MDEGKTARSRDLVRVAALFLLVAFVGYALLPRLDRPPSLVGKDAPDFALPVIVNGDTGSRIRITDLRGRAVLLDFWASWCAPCRAQAPVVDRVAERRQDAGLVVVGVSTGDERSAAVAFARRAGLGYPAVLDDGTAALAYGVRTLPTLVVVDRAGKVRAVRSRFVSERELDELVVEALGG